MNIVSVLRHHIGNESGTGTERQWHCPFCAARRGSESSKPKLRVNVVTGKAFCHRCGFAAGSMSYLFRSLGIPYNPSIEVDQRIESRGTSRAEAVVSSIRDMIAGPDLFDRRKLKPFSLPPEFIDIRKCAKIPHAKVAVLYLQSRNVTVERAIQCGLGYCPTGFFGQRLIFPVMQDGVCVYHTNRLVFDDPSARKTLNPPNREGYYGASDCLLGFDQCVGRKRVYIVEGPFDHLSTPDSVATLGKRMSDAQVNLLRLLAARGTEEFVIYYDDDADVLPSYRRLAAILPQVSYIKLKSGDPNSEYRMLDRNTKKRKMMLRGVDRIPANIQIG